MRLPFPGQPACGRRFRRPQYLARCSTEPVVRAPFPSAPRRPRVDRSTALLTLATRYLWQMTLSNRSNPVQSPDRARAGPHHGRSLHWFADGAAGWRGSPMGRRSDRRSYAACPARTLRLAHLAAITASPATSARAACTANPSMSQPGGQGHNLGPCWVREGRDHRFTSGHQRSPAERSKSLRLRQPAQRQRPDQIVVPKVEGLVALDHSTPARSALGWSVGRDNRSGVHRSRLGWTPDRQG